MYCVCVFSIHWTLQDDSINQDREGIRVRQHRHQEGRLRYGRCQGKLFLCKVRRFISEPLGIFSHHFVSSTVTKAGTDRVNRLHDFFFLVYFAFRS